MTTEYEKVEDVEGGSVNNDFVIEVDAETLVGIEPTPVPTSREYTDKKDEKKEPECDICTGIAGSFCILFFIGMIVGITWLATKNFDGKQDIAYLAGHQTVITISPNVTNVKEMLEMLEQVRDLVCNGTVVVV